MPIIFNIPTMTKYLKSNRQQLKNKIFSKLNLSANDDWQGTIDRESSQGSHQQLDKILRQTEKKKLSIRKLINTNNVHADFSDQMAQLRWRIEALKNFGRGEKEKLLAHRSNSLTGKDSPSPAHLTFDELYELQKRKFAMLRERRKTKASDPKYVEMIGNMQLRKEKRKQTTKDKLDQQMRTLNDSLQQPLE